MRILYVCSDFGIPPDGTKGPSIHLRSITAALDAAGASVRLLSPKPGPGGSHPLEPLLPVDETDAEKQAKRVKRWMVERGLGEELGKELRPILYNTQIVEPALSALRERPADVVLERLSLFGHVGVDLADATGLPLVLEVNALLSEEAKRYRSLLLTDPAERIEQRVLRRADAIMAVSRELADQIVARGIDARKVHVVENGADVERFGAVPPRAECKRSLGLGEDDFVTGFVGSLKVWHGADVLTRAFAKFSAAVKNARLLIVGAGPTEQALHDLAGRLTTGGAVVFTGAIPHERVPECVGAMDVAVAPYLPTDGFYFSPIKLFEYMAGGAAVVASRLGQIQQVVADGETGLLFEAGDEESLAACLKRLHDDRPMAARIAECARSRARERYTWRAAAHKVLAVLNGVVGRTGATAGRLTA